MERCRARWSYEKPRVEALPRLQVIGFNVSPPVQKAAPTASRGSLDMVSSAKAPYNELPISPSQLSKPAASSPRSALQQLLLHQSLPSTSLTSSDHSLPPLKPSPNQNSTLGLLQPATSRCPAKQKWTSGIPNPQSPPSAYQSKLSSACPKSLVQSELTTSDISANQSCRTSFFSSVSQSRYDNSSGGSQLINQHNAKPANAAIEENYEGFFQIKKAGDDGKARDNAKGRWIISVKPDLAAAKSKKSSWLHNDGNDEDDDHDHDHPSATEGCKKNSWKGIQPIVEHSPGNGKSKKSSRGEEKSKKSSRSEEKSKKSSVFIMFVASSPAAPPDYHHHGRSAEHNASKTADFLSSCHLCGRPLGQGQDVFMYSGDKAFCSMECRYEQIVIDERKERCPPPIIRCPPPIIRSGASLVFQHTSVTAMATHHPTMINKPYFINTAAAA